MAFPEDRLVHRLQAAFGADADASPATWSWTDITPDIHAQQITLTRGTANGAGQAQPTSISLVLDNPHGNYTPDHPQSVHYPGVDLGVPLRYSVEGGAVHLSLDGNAADYVSTPDAAALDITGDLDVRWEGEADWYASGAQMLIGKWGNAGQRSYHLRLQDGALLLHLGRDGTVGPLAGWILPPLPARAALRATISGGEVITLYWATSLAGPWTTLGSVPLDTPLTTGIFVSTAPLLIAPSQSGVTPPRTPVEGDVYGAEVRDGIDGTIVASPDFTAQAVGTTSFTDGAGRTWTLAGNAEINRWQHLFTGHVDSWEPVWPYGDLSDEDTGYAGESQVTVTASGILRRLGQGEEALDSTLRRRIPSYTPLAYWPMEDGSDATQASSPVEGVAPLKLTQAQWASADSLPSSSPLPMLSSSGSTLPQMMGLIPAPATALTSWSVNYLYRLDTPNTTTRTFLRILSTGTVADWSIQSSSSSSTIIGRDADGNILFTQGIGTGLDLYGQWVRVRFHVAQNGGNVDWRIDWIDVGGDAGGFDASYAGTIGRPTAVASPADGYSTDLDGLALGHIAAFPIDLTPAYDGAVDAWAGESAGNRFARLCDEEGIPYAVIGDPADSEPVGPQRPAPLLDLLAEAAAVDGGRLGERRSARGLQYRTRVSLYNQNVGMVLDAAANEIANPFAPVLDDQLVRNDISVQREGGSSARAVDEASVTKRRRYRDSPTVNAATDERLPNLAAWRLHLGTWPGMRYPSVSTELSVAPQLIDAWLQADTGDRINVVNLPPQHPTDTVDLLLEGYSQTLSPTRWAVQANCSPAGPYTVGVYDDSHRQTDGSELVAAVDSDDTTLIVLTTAGLIWTTKAADMPIDIVVGGERMAATAIAPFLADAFGRTSASSWGIADSGQTWQNLGGAASDFAVGSGYGRHTLSTADVTRRTAITAADPDGDFYGSITTSALATGASMFGAITMRMLDGENMYMARIEFTTTNTVVLVLRKLVANVGTDLGTYTVPVTHVAGAYIRVRLQATGSALRAKAWPATATEPDRWHISVTDTSITAANSFGTRSIRTTGNTNATTVQIRYDDFAVVNPQRFTVTRSANTIVKPHAADTAVRVYRPAVRAL